MSRRSLTWLLSLFLLLAQHGAVLHELSHLSQGSTAGASLHADGHALDSGACPTCHAFSQIASPVAAHAAGLSLPLAAIVRVPEPGYAIVAVDPPPPRSRGPPQV
jgi:hypothetical protein